MSSSTDPTSRHCPDLSLRAERRRIIRDSTGAAKFRHQAVAVALRVNPDGGLEVCLRPRLRDPYRGVLALPSGAVEVDETIDQAVLRHLNSTPHKIVVGHMEQVETRSALDRDPCGRTIATVYLVLVPVGEEIGEGGVPWTQGSSLSGDVWCPVDDIGDLAFDHHNIVKVARDRLAAKISYTNIAFALAPSEFTISQLRHVYAAVLGYDVAPTNLQRVLSRRGQLEIAGGMVKPHGGGRPARLYRFASREIIVTDPFAAFRP